MTDPIGGLGTSVSGLSAGASVSATQSYEEFLADIKVRIRRAQARAARAINAELIEVYWQIGRELEQQVAEYAAQSPRADRRRRSLTKL